MKYLRYDFSYKEYWGNFIKLQRIEVIQRLPGDCYLDRKAGNRWNRPVRYNGEGLICWSKITPEDVPLSMFALYEPGEYDILVDYPELRYV